MKSLFTITAGVLGVILTVAGVYNWHEGGFTFTGILDFANLKSPIHITIIGITAIIYALFEVHLSRVKKSNE